MFIGQCRLMCNLRCPIISHGGHPELGCDLPKIQATETVNPISPFQIWAFW